jgi:3-oxoacyl-[acyl-carrier protein] reductase
MDRANYPSNQAICLFRAPFFLLQQLLPILGKGSSIVLVSSLAAHASVGTGRDYTLGMQDGYDAFRRWYDKIGAKPSTAA